MKLLTFILFFSSQSLWATNYGTFMLVKGKVLIENSKSQQNEAKVSTKIYVGETVITDADSRAKIIMSDRNVLNVLPNTKLKIEKYVNSGAKKEVQLNLIQGKVRSNVSEKYDNKSSKYEIRTATAVAGVRGTEFITSYDPETKVTSVLTIHGQVVFKSVVPSATGGSDAPEVVINKQEKSEQKEGSQPSKPEKIPKKEFETVNKETNVVSEKKTEQSKDQAKGDGKQGDSGPANGKKEAKKDDKEPDINGDGSSGPGIPNTVGSDNLIKNPNQNTVLPPLPVKETTDVQIEIKK